MIIYGIHACQKSVLGKKGKILKAFLQINKPVFDWLPSNIKIVRLEEKEILKKVHAGAVHQGVLLEIDESSYYGDITDFAHMKDKCCVGILDGVVDPHNLGAVIRSAAAFNILGLIVSDKASCKLTGTVFKTASGGLEKVNFCVVKNLSAAIEKLKSYGFWIISFCERGDRYLHEVDLSGKTALVFGAEGTGIRRLQKEKSDFVVKLPTSLDFSTLNVSNAAAVSFYETAKQNGFFE